MKITKQTIFITIILGLIFLIIALFSIYFSVLAAFAETDILKSLIDVNAALIGFLGIIAVFVLTEYRSSLHRMEDEKDREKQDWKTKSKEKSWFSYDDMSGVGERVVVDNGKVEFDAHKTRMQNLEKDLSELRSNHKGSILIVVATVMSFLGSIIASLTAMSIKDIPSRALPIYVCMLLMLGGVVFMFLLVIGFAYYLK